MSFQPAWTERGLPLIQHQTIRDFRLSSGNVVEDARLGFCVFGEDQTLPLVLLHPALTGTPRAHSRGKPSQGDGWWSRCVGPGRLLDTNQFQVVCVDHFGGSGGSTGATELGERRHEVQFRDTVNLVSKVLEARGVRSLHAVVGGSVGGGQTLEWLFQDDIAVERLLDICGNCSRTGPAMEFFGLQADLLEGDAAAVPAIKERLIANCHDLLDKTPAFDHVHGRVLEGLDRLAANYERAAALELARQIGFLRFVTPLFFQKKWDARYRKTSDAELANAFLDSWLDHQGTAFSTRFSADAMSTLSRMEAGARLRSAEEVAARVKKTGCHLIGFAVHGDVLFDPERQFRYYKAIRAELDDGDRGMVDIHFAYDEVNGHDHFLSESFLEYTPSLAKHLHPQQELAGFETRTIHEGGDFREHTGALIPPIYLTSTFESGNKAGFDYTRSGNPNFVNLEAVLASMENARFATVFGSGVAAITAMVSSLKSGDLIIAEEVIYGCTYRLLDQVFSKFGVSVEYYDFANPDNFEVILRKKPAVVWVESPTNPLLKIIDIRELSKFTSRVGSTLVVDNTFASSFYQRPLDLGADISLASTTKYINGHSDALGGMICTNSPVWHQRAVFAQKALGLNPSPFDSWLITRGLKTLTLRMEKHAKNAFELAQFLETRPECELVRYPTLPSHPQYEVAMAQMDGGSGVVTVRLGFDVAQVRKFLSELTRFTLAESLGGIESLVCHPATMSHASVPVEERDKLGITDSLVRFSVGVERVSDLIDDIAQAFETAAT
jgi:cystathionine gamma-synthase